MTYKSFAAGYLIKDGKVLLAHHRKFDKWTPPGGHINEGETPDQAVIREWKEELSVDIEVIPAHPAAFAGDSNATPIPLPFHIDLEREGFDVPHIGYFFYVKLLNDKESMNVLKDELHEVRWFSEQELPNVTTFEQVRALAAFAINNYPQK